MPFEYTPYRSPFTGAIADLIGRQGDIAAQQALNEAKARTQTVSGVAQSLGNLAQYRADAPKREMERMRIAEARQQMADAQEARAGKQSLATLLSPDYVEGFQPQGPTPVDASGEAGILPKSPSLVKNIGGVKQLDPDAIQAAMGQLGHGAWFLENRNTIDNLNKSMLDRHVLGQKAIQNAADLYKRAARQSKDTLDDRFKVQAAQTLVDALDNIIPGDQLEAIQKALGVGDTRMIDQFANQYATPDKIEWLKTGPGEVNTPLNQYGQQVAPAIQGPERPKTPAQLADEAFGTPEDQRTPDQQLLVDGIVARAKALEATKRLPLNDEHAKLLEEQQNGTLTPAGMVRLRAIEQSLKYIPQFNVNNRVEPARSDVSSYNQIASRIEALAKPVIDRRANLQKIVDTLNTPNAVADSLVAPELLTAMAGGAGSGIRINEAEINRVLGARSTMQSIRAALMKVQSGETVTPEVRSQMSDLVKLVKSKVDRKATIVNEARQALAKADSIESQRQIFADMAQKLDDVDTDGSDTVKPGQLPSLNIRIGQMPGATAPVVGAR